MSIDDNFSDELIGRVALEKAMDIYADWYSCSSMSSQTFKSYVNDNYPFLYQVIMSFDEDYIHERLLDND